MNFMNDDSHINCITKILTKKLNLKIIDESSMLTKKFDFHENSFINTYRIITKIKNDRNKKYQSTQLFYFFQNLIYSIIMNLF